MTRATVICMVRGVISALLVCVPVVLLSQTDERPHRHPLNPMRAHLWLSFSSPDGSPRAPNLQFYSNRALSGPVTMALNDRGFIVGDVPVCVWPEIAARRGFGSQDAVTDLASARDPRLPCPADVPLRFWAYQGPFGAFIEISRLYGSVVEVRYGEKLYYFGLRSVPGDPWTGVGGGSILQPPEGSPPMLGGVDVPGAFRPTGRGGRFAVDLLASPKSGSPVVAILSTLRDFENFSLGDGAHVATVYARSNGWYLLRLFDGRTAWLSRDGAGKYVALERLYERGPTGIWAEWDRTLMTLPGGGEKSVAGLDPRRAWIGYLDSGAQPGAFAVYSSPNKNEPPIGRFDDRDFDSINAGTQGERPIVFSRLPGWLEVGLDNERRSYRDESVKHVWIEDDPGRWSVRHVAAVEREKLLTAEWGLEAWPAVEVMETRRVNGELWLRVSVVAGAPCEFSIGDVDEIVLGEGWIRAHAPSGRPMVWYETFCD